MSTCVSCSRKFAAPYSATNTHLCRTCRSSIATSMVAATSSPQATTSSSVPLKAMNSSQKLLLTSTPKVTKSGGGSGSGGKQGSGGGGGSGGIGSGRNLVPMRCKICNTSFRYRRCLFRHLRENHPGIFSNKDIYSYVMYMTLYIQIPACVFCLNLSICFVGEKILWPYSNPQTF